MSRIADPHRRQDIVNAARQAFRADGFDKTHMSDIARRAKIAVGTLYLYFDSKEDVARAIATETFAAAANLVLPQLEGRLTRAKIVKFVTGAFDVVLGDESSFTWKDLPLHDAMPTMAPDAYHAVVSAIASALARQMRDGSVKRYDPTTIADYVVILIRRGVLEAAADDHRAREPYASTLIRLLCAVLLPGRPPARRRRSNPRAALRRAARKR